MAVFRRLVPRLPPHETDWLLAPTRSSTDKLPMDRLTPIPDPANSGTCSWKLRHRQVLPGSGRNMTFGDGERPWTGWILLNLAIFNTTNPRSLFLFSPGFRIGLAKRQPVCEGIDCVVGCQPVTAPYPASPVPPASPGFRYMVNILPVAFLFLFFKYNRDSSVNSITAFFFFI